MWKQKLIDTARGTFEYFVSGQGEPLAITHFYMSFNVNGNHFANPFTSHYQVFLINVRGAGNSPVIEYDEQLNLQEVILDLEAIREALQFEKWAFAGHSTGGMLALQYVVNAEQSLTKIICGCSSASKDYAVHPNSIYCRENKNFNRMIEIMESLNKEDTSVEQRKELYYEWNLMSFLSEDKLRYALSKPNSGKIIGRALNYFRKVVVATFDLRNEIKNITIPVFVFGGLYDAQCPIECSYEIAKLIPNAKITVFNESNHFPFIEEEETFKKYVVELASI